jgi:Tol biopolymer transport system component
MGGNDGNGDGLFKAPINSDRPVRLISGVARNPVWSPDGMLIAFVGADLGGVELLQAVRPDGSSVIMPGIKLPAQGERMRFTPGSKKLIYMQGSLTSQNFWQLDLTSKATRQITQLDSPATMRTFDISPDGKQIVFDRLRQNSDIVLIERPN